MGAVICKESIEIPKGSHTSTFGGNPLACASALATIEFIEHQGLVEKAAENGNYLIESLRKIQSPRIREVRGMGLMVGIELNVKAGIFVRELMRKGIIVLLAGKNVIRLLPPLVITKDEIDRVVKAMEETLC